MATLRTLQVGAYEFVGLAFIRVNCGGGRGYTQ